MSLEYQGRGTSLNRLRMAKAKINPPEHPISDLNYQRSCQLALEPSLTKLLDSATNAGWDLHQATYAVMILAATNLRNQAPSEEPPAEPESKDSD
jgi:hypothetical protein